MSSTEQAKPTHPRTSTALKDAEEPLKPATMASPTTSPADLAPGSKAEAKDEQTKPTGSAPATSKTDEASVTPKDEAPSTADKLPPAEDNLIDLSEEVGKAKDETPADIPAADTATDPFAVGDGDLPDESPSESRGETGSTGSALDASVTTLKSTPSHSSTTTTTMKLLDVEASKTADAATYIDPTPPTPMASHPPSRSPSNAASHSHRSTESSPSRSDNRYASEDERENGSRTEIQTIMEQFSEAGGGPGAEEVMSPRFEIASPMLSAPIQHPPRKSSLEPLAPNIAKQIRDTEDVDETTGEPASPESSSKQKEKEEPGPPVPPKDLSSPTKAQHDEPELPLSPTVSIHRPPPPEPEPEPAVQFDFHRFLEQLRNKKADPVARYLKSFLSEFGKRQWMVHEQVKIISDFLAFIANKMAVCEVWRDLSDAEFDNAREGMEKLVMNRLYTQTFSPAIPPPQPIPGAKPKRRGGERPMGPGRKGQHQEDVERDEILTQKINIYGWIREEHLDIPPVGDGGKRFLKLAQQELLKIKTYRAPRDKIICVLNCCKVIFGLLKHNKSDSSADSFMPLLIYVVLQANPDHLVSNVQYILRFRNQDKLGGEAGYYLSSLMGVIQFVENMDRTTLTISDDEFEKNVEAAVSAIAEKHARMSPPLPTPPLSSDSGEGGSKQTLLPNPKLGDPSSVPRKSSDSNYADSATPRRSFSPGDGDDDRDAITGLLRTIQKPLSSIGRIFSDETPSPSKPRSRSPVYGAEQAGAPAPAPVVAPGGPVADPSGTAPDPRLVNPASSRRHLSAEVAAARQASAEAAEAQRIHRVEHASVVETLASMFPDLDRDIISDVVYQKEGRVGLAVDACLALSS